MSATARDPLQEESRLIQLLDERHSWPCEFAFKFIVPADRESELKSLVPEALRVECRPSSGGKYHAFTFHCPMGSGREVLGIYARVQTVKGLIAL